MFLMFLYSLGQEMVLKDIHFSCVPYNPLCGRRVEVW